MPVFDNEEFNIIKADISDKLIELERDRASETNKMKLPAYLESKDIIKDVDQTSSRFDSAIQKRQEIINKVNSIYDMFHVKIELVSKEQK